MPGDSDPEAIVRIDGNLLIEKLNSEVLLDLSCLEEVTDSVTVGTWLHENRNLRSLAGLSALKNVGERLRVVVNEKLTDLGGVGRSAACRR